MFRRDPKQPNNQPGKEGESSANRDDDRDNEGDEPRDDEPSEVNQPDVDDSYYKAFSFPITPVAYLNQPTTNDLGYLGAGRGGGDAD